MGELTAIVMTIFSACGQGLIWGVMTLGVFITFKVLNFADMTCDGSFALGGCVSIVCTYKLGVNPFFCLFISIAAGMLAGLITSILNTKLKIPPILSGILTMISLYSINLRIMSNKSNLSISPADKSMIDMIKGIIPAGLMEGTKDNIVNYWVVLIIGLIVGFLLILLLYWFFGTEVGSALRATGDNEEMIRALGQNTDTIKILALVVSNGLIALSGSLLAQQQRVADINMGQGAIVMGLAAIVIGEVLFGRKNISFKFKLFSVIIGAVLYRVIIAGVIYLGMPSTDLKLLTAIIVAIALSVPVLNANRKGGYKKALRPDSLRIESVKGQATESNQE